MCGFLSLCPLLSTGWHREGQCILLTTCDWPTYEKRSGQILLHLWGLIRFGGQSCIIHSNKVLFGLEEAAMSFYLTGSDFQNRIAKHSVLRTLQNAVSSAVGAIHALTSSLGTMGNPVINSCSENLLYSFRLTWSGGFWMWNGFLRCQLFWPWFGGYPAPWAGSLQLQFDLSCLGSYEKKGKEKENS